jgi:hypothetical protein
VAAIADLIFSIRWWGLARLMNGEQIRQDASLEDLLAAGKEALARGDRRIAHELYRAAAVINPYDPRVWVALLDVITRDDDREVCLQNIIATDPYNPEARRQLRGLRRDRRIREEAEFVTVTRLPTQRKGGSLLGRAVLLGVGIGLLAVALGVIASVVMYSGLLTRLVVR